MKLTRKVRVGIWDELRTCRCGESNVSPDIPSKRAKGSFGQGPRRSGVAGEPECFIQR